MAALIINIDDFKEQILGYDPCRAEEFYTQSAKMADKAYEEALKAGNYKEVIFLCGGSASGKTEFVDSYLKNSESIIYDSTFSSNEGAKIKIRLALKKHVRVTVVFIQLFSISESIIAFQNRDRKFGIEHFVRTHHGSRENFLFLLKKYPEITFLHVISRIDEDGKMIYYFVEGDIKKRIEIMEKQQLTEVEIYHTLKSIK